MQQMRWILAAALGLAVVVASVGVGVAASGLGDHRAPTVQPLNNGPDDEAENEPGEAEKSEYNDSDEALTGSDAEKAAQAAQEYTGGGRVLEVEYGDDGAAYGVEILRPDGQQVEVHLDTEFNVIGDEADDD